MAGVFFLNPERYLTPNLLRLPGIKFFWYRTWIDETGFDPAAWMASVGGKESQGKILDRAKIETSFDKGIWSDKRGNHYCDPVGMTEIGYVRLPNGHDEKFSFKLKDWLKKFKMDDFLTDQSRAEFNVNSVMWAKQRLGYNELSPVGYGRGRGVNIPHKERVVCDTCYFRNTCEYAMKGSVCILPKSEAGVFAKLIGSRKTSEVLDGLRLMVVAGGTRLEDALQSEVKGEPSKEVTGLMNSVFNQAIQLAKLQDPSLRASPKIQIGINGAGGAISIDGSVATPSQGELASNLKELVEQGVPLENISEELLIDYMDAKNRRDATAMKQIAVKYNIVDAEPEAGSLPF